MSIRLRVTLVFALALAIAFAAGGWLFISRISAAILKSTDAALALRLSQAGNYLEDDSSLRTPVVTGTPVPGEFVVQIIGPSGQVKHASANAGTRPLLSAAELITAA